MEALPADRVANVLGPQLLRAGTSVAANYRAAMRAKSRADFISKLGTVEEECDECLFWLELLENVGRINRQHSGPLMKEGGEILAMTVSSIRTARNRTHRTSTFSN